MSDRDGPKASTETTDAAATRVACRLLILTGMTRRRLRFAEFTATLTRPHLTAAALPPGPWPWTAVLAVEGVETGDRRIIDSGALTWRDLPLPLLMQDELPEMGGHAGAWAAGVIDSIERVGGEIRASGVFPDTDEGRRAAGLVASLQVTGVSVDLDDLTAQLEGPDGGNPWRDLDEQAADAEDSDEPIRIGGDTEPLLRVTEARIIGATVTPHPAIPGATITLTVTSDTSGDASSDPAVTAAAAHHPPAAWFADPQLTAPTPLTVTDDGRVTGHIATWNTCHIGYDRVCLTADPSATGYAYFLTGAVEVDDGTVVPVGQLTMDTGHADLTLDHRAATAHYDDTGSVWADVTCGDDEHGIWIAGAARPHVTPDQLARARAAALSGDWRRIGGHLELVAVLSVNVPGFPITRARAAAGTCLALVAAGPRPLTVAERVERLERLVAGLTPRPAGNVVALTIERLTRRVHPANTPVVP